MIRLTSMNTMNYTLVKDFAELLMDENGEPLKDWDNERYRFWRMIKKETDREQFRGDNKFMQRLSSEEDE